MIIVPTAEEGAAAVTLATAATLRRRASTSASTAALASPGANGGERRRDTGSTVAAPTHSTHATAAAATAASGSASFNTTPLSTATAAGSVTGPPSLSAAGTDGAFDGVFEEPVVKAGWLWKRGRWLKTWKLRLFVLQGHELRYYTPPPALAAALPARAGGTRPLPSADAADVSASWQLAGRLSIASVAAVATAYKVDKPTRFYIATMAAGAAGAASGGAGGAASNGGGTRSLFLQAPTDADMREWMAVFRVFLMAARAERAASIG